MYAENQTNSPKGNMLYNQNIFSNKRNSFIPKINSNLATLVTSYPSLKSSMHSTHNNSKTLEVLNKSSVVDFTIDEILTELEMIARNIMVATVFFRRKASRKFLLHTLLCFSSLPVLFVTKKKRSKEGKKHAPQIIFWTVLKS